MNNGETLLHERCQKVLFQAFPSAPPTLILKCCDEWIEKGHKIPAGVVKYFRAYFIERNDDI